MQLFGPAQAVSWQLATGRDECVSSYMPDHQWDIHHNAVRVHGEYSTPGEQSDPEQTSTTVTISAGFVVREKYAHPRGGHLPAVDVALYDSAGQLVYSKQQTSDDEIEVNTYGTKGPYKLCFKVTRLGQWKPSIALELTHFVVNHAVLRGSHLEARKSTKQALRPVAHGNHNDTLIAPEVEKELVTKQYMEDLTAGLAYLDQYLQSVKHELRYQHQRGLRSLETVHSTHARSMWCTLAINGAIVAACILQVLGVQYMFRHEGRLPSTTFNLNKLNRF